MLKIFQGPVNIAGGANLIAKAFRELGYKSISYSLYKNLTFKYESDLYSNGSFINKFFYFIKLTLSYNCFTFWFGNSFFGLSLKDIPFIAKIPGKKVYFYFNGCDIRNEKDNILNKEVSLCSYCKPKQCNPNRDHALKIAEKYATKIFVSTPDLLEYANNSTLIYQPIDIKYLDQVKKNFTKNTRLKNFIVSHAPTNSAIKGTKFLVDAIDELKEEGFNIDLQIIQNLPHKEALKKYMTSDIAVDQLLAGSYGVTAAEMMYLGVPCISYIRQDLVSKYDSPPPIISASPTTIKSVIKDLYKNREELKDISFKSIEYSRKYHSPTSVAKSLLKYYQK